MSKFLEAARSLIGTPFHWHQRTPGPNGGVDCLGLVICSMRIAGVLEQDFNYLEYGNANFDMQATFRGPGESLFERIYNPEPGAVVSLKIKGKTRHMGIVDTPHLIHAHQIYGVIQDRYERWDEKNLIDEIYRLKWLT